MSPTNHVFSAFSFITLILVTIPLPWHLEAWNTGTVIYIGWTSLALLNYFINSVVWNDSIRNVAPVWCDVSTRLQVGAAVGIPTAALCINRRLFYISKASTMPMDKRDKYKQVAVDACIGILIPVICVILHYVVQGHRFDIFEDVGCVPATYNVTLQYVLVQTPTLVIPLVSCIYAALAIRNLIKREGKFKALLSGSSLPSSVMSSGSNNSIGSLTSSRYFRLMALASMEMIIGLPVALTVCILNATVSGPVYPWISWEDTHADFGRVDQFPSVAWRSSSLSTARIEWSRWMMVVCGLMFFIFFGFAEEAKRNYAKIWRFMGKCAPGVGRTFEAFSGKRESFGNFKITSGMGQFAASSNFARFKVSTPGSGGNASNAALPIYVEKEIINKRDSFDTFTSADLASLRSGSGSTTVKLSSTAGMSKNNTPTPSTSQSRSGSPSPTRPRPRVEITSEIYPESFEVHPVGLTLRTPESAFPRSVTPEVEAQPSQVPISFLEMVTPATEGFSPLAKVENPYSRPSPRRQQDVESGM